MGFTFIEVMETVAILSIGVVAIFQAFFINMDAFNSSLIYLDGQRLINNKMWKVEQTLRDKEVPVFKEPPVTMHNRTFEWNILLVPVGLENLYRVNVSLLSTSSNIKLSRTSYVLRQLIEEEDLR